MGRSVFDSRSNPLLEQHIDLVTFTESYHLVRKEREIDPLPSSCLQWMMEAEADGKSRGDALNGLSK